jgi:hypothetical protein
MELEPREVSYANKKFSEIRSVIIRLARRVMGRACSIHGRDEICMQNFGQKS